VISLRVSLVLVLVLGASASGCAAWPRRWSDRPCCIDTKPAVRRQPIWWHLFDVTVLEPLEQPFHLVRPGRRLIGVPMQAINLDDGRLAGSAFFTGRDPASLTPEQVRWGPTRPDDVAVPPFTVTKSKQEGKTAGFFVVDARGERYLFKLDPVEAPELLSGAEVITSKLLYALGYRVPSYEAVDARPEEFRVAPDAVIKDGAKEAPFTEDHLRELLAPRVRQGTVRMVSSKLIDGEVLGPARFKQFRDCADVRALKLAYAWVNNIDTKDHNSLLAWNGTETLGYLIDFGTALGADAGAGGPKDPCAGWKYIVDLKETSLEMATLGRHRTACDTDPSPPDARLGLFSERVDPRRWKPYAPNLAFKEMTDEDAEWMALRMRRLSRAQLEAAVAAGRYSDPEAERRLVNVLEARRWTIINAYLDDDEDDDEDEDEEVARQ